MDSSVYSSWDMFDREEVRLGWHPTRLHHLVCRRSPKRSGKYLPLNEYLSVWLKVTKDGWTAGFEGRGWVAVMCVVCPSIKDARVITAKFFVSCLGSSTVLRELRYLLISFASGHRTLFSCCVQIYRKRRRPCSAVNSS